MNRHPHILNASTNLLGICFVIIGSLKLTNMDPKSYSDEVAWVAACFLFFSTIFSYIGIRNGDPKIWQGRLAEGSFLMGVFSLMISVVIAATFL
jgi:hypothetical protein